MAIVKAPALSLAASGNLGGINYTRWRGRAVARSSWSPTIPNTALQQGIQAHLTLAVTQWRTVLTQAQRDLWNRYAKTQTTVDRLGEIRIPSGYNLYIGRQIQAFRATALIILEPPVDIVDETVTKIIKGASAVPGVVRWRLSGFTSTWRPDNYDYWLSGPYDSEARNPTEEEWRFHGFRTDNNFEQHNGVAAKWYWCRGRWMQDDGRKSNWFQIQIQAVA